MREVYLALSVEYAGRESLAKRRLPLRLSDWVEHSRAPRTVPLCELSKIERLFFANLPSLT